MLQTVTVFMAARHRVLAERVAVLRVMQDERAAMLRAANVVYEKRMAALHALADREEETSAREALVVDRAISDPEAGAMEDAPRHQESRVLLSICGSFFETPRASFTAIRGSMLKAMSLGRQTIATGEEGLVFDRDGKHLRLVLNFMRDCGSDATAVAIRALPDTQLRELRGELDYCGLGAVVLRVRFWLERGSFVSGSEVGFECGY